MSNSRSCVTSCLAGLLLLWSVPASGQLKIVSEELIPEPSVPLLQNSKVAEELRITDVQEKRLEAVFDSFSEYFGLLRAAKKQYLTSAIGQSAAEQIESFKKLKELGSKENGKLRSAVYEILDDRQERRLKQIVFQYHLEQSNYELIFKQLGIKYDKHEVRQQDRERKKTIAVEVSRLKFKSQMNLLTENYQVQSHEFAAQVGDVFDFNSGRSIPFVEDEAPSGNPRRGN